MKKIVAVIVLVLSLTACGSKSKPAPAPISDDQAYLTEVHKNISVGAFSDSDLIALGHNICSAFDSGATLGDIAELGMNNNLPAYDTGFIISASILAYCPQHKILVSP